MNIRIIAGWHGSRIIKGSGTRRTHPMSERIRGAIFNSIGREIDDARVLDAFAGSGALGLEAISRGAKEAVFVERDRIAQKVIAKNIASLHEEERAHLSRATISSWLGTYDGEDFDIIFADPPYYDPQLSTAIELLGLLKPNGLMVLSYPGKGEVPTELGDVVVDIRSYGDAALAFYRREGA